MFWGKGMYRSHSLDDPNRGSTGCLTCVDKIPYDLAFRRLGNELAQNLEPGLRLNLLPRCQRNQEISIGLRRLP
jgi:hypothetical protein